MTEWFCLVHDGFRNNRIPRDAEFLEWKLLTFHVDCFEQGPGELDRNQWALTVETSTGQVQLIMDDSLNSSTGGYGVLELKVRHTQRRAEVIVVRESYDVIEDIYTVRDLLNFIFYKGLHRFTMTAIPFVRFRGYRHHL